MFGKLSLSPAHNLNNTTPTGVVLQNKNIKKKIMIVKNDFVNISKVNHNIEKLTATKNNKIG